MIRLATLVLVSLLLLACSGDDDSQEPDASPRPTFAATPRPGTTAIPGATVRPTISVDDYESQLQLKGVYRPPEITHVAATAQLPERPKTDFAAWDGASVVVYDIETGEAHDFGPGSLARPAFGEHYFVYTSADHEVYAVDLRTMQKQFIAKGILAYFLGNDYVVVNPGDNNFFGVDMKTRERIDLAELRDPLLQSMASLRWGGSFLARWIDGRYAVRPVENPQAVCEGSGPEQRLCLADTSSKWLVEDVWTEKVVLAFEANAVQPAGPGEIVIATTPLCNEANWITDCPEVLSKLEAQAGAQGAPAAVQGTTNIFIVNLTTGEATFVATASFNARTGAWPMKWPLVANADFVAWTESYCGEPRGLTRIYNRATGQITELNVSEWLYLADGRLGIGENGATAIIDPLTFEYTAVLPELSGPTWSKDLRYAAVGQSFGRGSVCG